MADCGNSDYQAIEHRSLFDLRDAFIVRAEIDSIDSTNNAAAVTLLDTCEALDTFDTTAVPFFYHCETSTGTVEDLALGYRAFSVADIVFLLVNLENGDLPTRAYIVGHVDRRDTSACGVEYFSISVSVGVGEDTVTAMTIVDAVSGQVLDLSTFVDREGSPTRPSSVPFIDGDAWFNYNFSGITNTIYTRPATITKYNNDLNFTSELYNAYISGLVPKTKDTLVSYTGMWYVDKPKTCADLSLGNGYAEDTETYSGQFDEIVGTNVLEHFSTVYDSADKAPHGGHPCEVYFREYLHEVDSEYTYPPGHIYIRLIDSVTSVSHTSIITKFEEEHYRTTQTAIGGVTGESGPMSATVSHTYSLSTVYGLDFTSFGAGTFTITDEASWSATGLVGDTNTTNYTESATCSNADWSMPNLRFHGVAGLGLTMFRFFGGGTYMDAHTLSIGSSYVCTLWGGFYYKEYNVLGANGPSGNPVKIEGSSWMISGTSVYIIAPSSFRYAAEPVAFATVTPISDLTLFPLYEGQPANRFSITDALNNVDRSRSIAVSMAVGGLIEFINGTITDPSVFANVQNAFQYLQSPGPYIYAVKKYGT